MITRGDARKKMSCDIVGLKKERGEKTVSTPEVVMLSSAERVSYGTD